MNPEQPQPNPTQPIQPSLPTAETPPPGQPFAAPADQGFTPPPTADQGFTPPTAAASDFSPPSAPLNDAPFAAAAAPPPAAPMPTYAQQPMSASQPRRRGTSRKTVGVIVIAVIILGIASVVGYAMMQKPSQGNGSITVGNTTPPAASPSPASNSQSGGAASDVISRTDGKLDLSKLIDTSTSIKSQNLTAQLNQQVNLSDGVSYMVTAVTRNVTAPSGTLAHPADGKEFIKVSLAIGNRAQKGNYAMSDGDFQVKDSTGALLLPMPILASAVPDILKSQEITPGQQISGSIVYQVVKDEKVSLTTSQKYSLIGNPSAKEAVVASEVALQ